MRIDFRGFRTDLANAANDWVKHNNSSQGAAIAFYAIFSLAPLLVVVVAIAGIVLGPAAVRGEVYYHIKNAVGGEAALTVQTLLKALDKPAAGIVASVISFGVALLGGSGVFLQLRQTLNYIWGVDPDIDAGIRGMVRSRLFSFSMIIGIGFLLIVLLSLSAFLISAGSYASRFVKIPPAVLDLLNFIVTFAATTFLFGVIYRVVPETRVDWDDVITGSIVTALLFDIGKVLIGLYLGKASVGSAYGAAGSLVILLGWVYYSAQIFLFGAEFTHVFAQRKMRTRLLNPGPHSHVIWRGHS